MKYYNRCTDKNRLTVPLKGDVNTIISKSLCLSFIHTFMVLVMRS